MRILTVSPPSRIVWIYAWTASRTSCERFPCDVLPFRNSSISSRFSFSSRSVIRSFSSIRIPRLNRGKGYDEVIHHSAQLWRVVRRILEHGTYTCCQLSYDVGQRASIAARNHAQNGPGIFILYAIWKTPLRSHKPGSIHAPIRREKLYENRSYVHAWRRSHVPAAVDGKGRSPAAPRDEAFDLDRGPGQSPIAPPSGLRKRGRTRSSARRRTPGAWRNRATCRRSRRSGNPRGSGNTCTSRARMPAARSGTPPCRIHT